jgi:hypothetical protein
MPKPYVGKYRTCKWLFDLLPQCGRARTLVRNRKTLTAKKKNWYYDTTHAQILLLAHLFTRT